MEPKIGREEGESGDEIALEITQLDMVEDENLMTSSMRGKLEAISYSPCIFHVPSKFLIQHEDSYHPKVVSIGPFHHGEAHLQHMENHKWKYLNALLGRNLDLNFALNSCTRALKELEPKIRACYQGDISFLRSEDFLTIILVDAGFVIELLLRYCVRGLRRRDDPLFKSPEKFHVLRNDLILLQNQIPFFVLRKLFTLVPLPKQCDRSVSELSLRFFRNLVTEDLQLLQEKYSFEASNHLLDLIWKCYLPSTSKTLLSSGSGLGRHLHSVSTLQKGGIKVKKTDAESILDVKFINGKLVIPSLEIHNYMESLFRNMIALENCHGEMMKHVTSYVYLMKGLLQSKKDVKIFFRREIFMANNESKEDQMISLFNDLCQNVDLEKFYYEGMWEKLMGYRRTRWDVLCYKMKPKFPQGRNQKRRFNLIVSVIFLILIGILFILLYIFVIHHKYHSR